MNGTIDSLSQGRRGRRLGALGAAIGPLWTSLRSIRPHLLLGSILLWAVITTPIAIHLGLTADRWPAYLAIAAAPTAWLLRRSPWQSAVVIVAGASLLRLSFVGLSTSDQPLLAQLALQRALAGENPFGGHVYASGSAYAYGPLGLIWYQGGIPLEFAATLATSALLIWARAWMASAFYNAWPQFLLTPVIGYNDYSVGFIVLLAIILLRSRPIPAMVLLSMAIAIKPYAAAWLIPAIGYVGLGVALVAGVASLLVFWAPVLVVWGVPSFVASAREIEADRGPMASMYPSWSFADQPWLRLLAGPISLIGLLLRSWSAMALLGCATFVVFLGFSAWAHVAYLAVVIPVLGAVLEWRPPTRTRGRRL